MYSNIWLEKERQIVMTHLRLNSEAGIAVIITMIMIFISSIIASSYLSLVLYESRNSVWQMQRVQALFVAEAGVQKGLYYLNNSDSRPSEWGDDNGQLLPAPLQKEEGLVDGRSYNISLHDSSEQGYEWLPSNSYLIESDGAIERSSGDVERSISCVVTGGTGPNVPAAVTIVDDPDGEDEINKFNGNAWTVDGRDIDGGPGVPGVLITNDEDGLHDQFPSNRINRITGEDEDGFPTQGEDAIVEDPNIEIDLDAIIDSFRDDWEDISGSGTIAGHTTYGAPDDFVVVYADLDQGDIHFSGQATGYGVLIVENLGETRELFISGKLEWNGIVICADNSDVIQVGGGDGMHVIGGLFLENGIIDVRGNADIVYSSVNVGKVGAMISYKIRSWCGGWGNPL